MQHPLSEKIQTYIQGRADAKLEKLDKELKKKSAQGLGEDECDALKEKAIAQYMPNVWLSDAAKRASQIKLVTHALKFTHTEARGSSVYFKPSLSPKTHYLHSGTLLSNQVDVVGNAAALDVAGLLKLEADKQTVYELVAKGDASVFSPFAQNQAQLDTWLEGLGQVFSLASPATHKYAKQTYFPVEEGYHLLASLFSSTLTQAIHERLMENRFSEQNKHIRAQKRNALYCEANSVDYPNLAVQGFGGTKPQNVSQLNSARAGRVYLFPSSPPVWQRQQQVPKTSFSFWVTYSRRASSLLRELVSFLKPLNDYTNIAIRDKREAMIEQAIDIFLVQSTQIREMRKHAGWSDSTELTEFEQCWLDPYRQDEAFQQVRQSNDWVPALADRFARRLNEQLRFYGLNVAKAEHQTWLKEVRQSMMADVRMFNE